MLACNRSRVRPSVHRLQLETLEDRSQPNATPGSALDNLAVDAARFAPDHVIVALRPGTGQTDLAAIAPNLVLRSSVLDAAAGLDLVELRTGVSVADGVAFFQAQAFVRYAQPDYYVSMAQVPSDTSFRSQWGLNNTGQSGGTADADIDAPEAWDVTTGSGAVVVAVIDSDVDWTHPDLKANIWANADEVAGNGKDDDGNGYVDDVRGWDFANWDNNPMDDNGHGTHVAGIIGAVGNNGIGVAGVAWSVKLMPLKFLDASGGGSTSNAVRALTYAVANGATISNNSWGGGGFHQPMYDAINAARAAGHVFVAAAGNDGLNNDLLASYPGNYNLDNIVSVASTTSTDARSSFSNYGAATVDLGAPGSSIYSTYRGGGYTTLSGTSMATPFVTGAIALVRDLHPDWTYRQVIDQVLDNTDPVASLQGRTATGGRLNLYRALTGQAPADTGGPKVTAAAFSGAAASSFDKVRLTFSEAVDAATFTADDVVSFKRDGQNITGLTYTVTQVSSTVFDVSFAAQTAVGSYALTVGPDVADLAGNTMNQNGNSVNGETPGDQYTATASLSSIQTFSSTEVPKTIVDAATTTSRLTVSPSLTVGKVTVKLNVSHTWDGDLKISLRSPAGTTVTLVNRRGSWGDNFTNTVFDSSAASSIVYGSAPFAGTYRPEQSLTAFNGQNAAGTWTLIVQDLAYGDVGRINSWSITVTPTNGGNSIRSIGASSERSLSGPAEASASAPLTTVAAPQTPRRPLHAGHGVREAPPQVGHRTTHAADAGFVVTSPTRPAAHRADWLDFDAREPLGVTSRLVRLR